MLKKVTTNSFLFGQEILKSNCLPARQCSIASGGNIMSLQQVQRLFKQPENIRLEFKEATSDLPQNLFETICAMLNRNGGDVVLGVNDSGTITGVVASKVQTMVTNIVNLSNNPQKIDPPFILFPQVYEIRKKHIIHIQVPCSSQVHKSVHVVYDRSNDGDFKVAQAHRISEIHNRKRNHFTEGAIHWRQPCYWVKTR